jgi:uncharacterized DUF497 family protein
MTTEQTTQPTQEQAIALPRVIHETNWNRAVAIRLTPDEAVVANYDASGALALRVLSARRRDGNDAADGQIWLSPEETALLINDLRHWLGEVQEWAVCGDEDDLPF